MFDDLLLSEQASKRLQSFLQRPSQAVLLSGQSGIGLTSIALHLAQLLLHGTEMKSLENEQYFRLLTTQGTTIPIEAIRALHGFFTLSVPGGSAQATAKRVVIIDNADTMLSEAQNALLKLLEEPPEGSVLLLVSSKPKRLLETIRSRTSRLNLTAPTKAQVIAWFSERGSAVTDIERAYLMADGSISRMVSLLSGETTTMFSMVRTVLAGKPFERLVQVEPLSKDKQAAQDFVTSLVQVASASLERSAAHNPGSLNRWQHVLQAGVTAQESLEQNGNTKLVLTDLMLSL